MKAIRSAVQRHLDLESQLKIDFLAPSPEAYNQTLLAYTDVNLHPGIRSIYSSREGAYTDERAAIYAKMSPPAMRRKCCKISTYGSDKYGTIYAVYLSSLLPPLADRVDYQKCYWWTIGESGEPGIVADYTWPFGDEPEKSWFFNSGDREIKFEALNAPTEIDRITPPVSDPAAMQDYQAMK